MLSILGLIDPPGRITSGKIFFQKKGERIDLATLNRDGEDMRRIRGAEIALIFQDPMNAFPPVYSIGDQIVEAIQAHQPIKRRKALEMAVEYLDRVGIAAPRRCVGQYPHQLSGGMIQRAMVALALSGQPQVLMADEPTTALDVTIQAQILDLLSEIQREERMTVLLITHDWGIAAEMAQKVVVMYLGMVVEEGPVHLVLQEPCHPYTKGLLQCIAVPTSRRQTPIPTIRGSVHDNRLDQNGCPFRNRCTSSFEQCGRRPALKEVGAQRRVACWLYNLGTQD
jgi:peptide/nickel transport system ATP-binding protein